MVKRRQSIPQIYIQCNLLFDNDTCMEEITQEIGLNPSSCKNKREQRKSPFKDDNLEGFWSIETEMMQTFDLEEATKNLVNTVNPYLEKIKQTVVAYTGSVDFVIVADFHKSNAPALCFNHEFLDVVNYLNATIQIDMYVD